MASIHEIGCPPDQLEVDAVTAFFFGQQRPVDGPAGLLDRRLHQCLTRHLQSAGEEHAYRRLLVKSGNNVAASWVLFYPAGDDVSQDSRVITGLLENVIIDCANSGFQRIAIAPPVHSGKEKKQWLDCLEKAIEQCGKQMPECLVSFDDSYLHDHSAPVLNL